MEERPDVYRESEILYTEGFLKSFFRHDQKVILVALTNDEIIAYGFIECMKVNLPMMVERQYAYIHDFAVSEEHREQGVATRLLAYIEEYASGNGASRIELAVHLFSKEAIGLYEKIRIHSTSTQNGEGNWMKRRSGSSFIRSEAAVL